MRTAQARLYAVSTTYTDVELSSQVEGASPHQLVQILFQELVRNLGLMEAAITAGNFSRLGSSYSRTLAILTWLQSTLDMERGGEVAATLATIYIDCRRRTSRAARDRDLAQIQIVQETIGEIAGAWSAIGPKFTPPSTGPVYASSR